MVKSLGADIVLDHANEDFTKNGLTYDVILDVSGKPSTLKFKTVSERLTFLKEIIKLFKERKLNTIIDQSFPLEQMVEAHRYLERGLEKGNVVVNI